MSGMEPRPQHSLHLTGAGIFLFVLWQKKKRRGGLGVDRECGSDEIGKHEREASSKRQSWGQLVENFDENNQGLRTVVRKFQVGLVVFCLMV